MPLRHDCFTKAAQSKELYVIIIQNGIYNNDDQIEINKANSNKKLRQLLQYEFERDRYTCPNQAADTLWRQNSLIPYLLVSYKYAYLRTVPFKPFDW